MIKAFLDTSNFDLKSYLQLLDSFQLFSFQQNAWISQTSSETYPTQFHFVIYILKKKKKNQTYKLFKFKHKIEPFKNGKEMSVPVIKYVLMFSSLFLLSGYLLYPIYHGQPQLQLACPGVCFLLKLNFRSSHISIHNRGSKAKTFEVLAILFNKCDLTVSSIQLLGRMSMHLNSS